MDIHGEKGADDYEKKEEEILCQKYTRVKTRQHMQTK